METIPEDRFGKHEKSKKEYSHADKAIMTLISFLYIAVVLFLSVKNDLFFYVILGTLPTLVYIVINFVYLKEMERKHTLVWLLPMPLLIVFAVIGSLQTSIVQNIDWQSLTALNLVLCYVFAGFIVFIGSPPKKKRQAIKQNVEVTKETFLESLRGIEDKCKTINFVVGRVYSDKKGGSKSIRDKIKFPREWYNTFSELTEDYDSSKKHELSVVLGKILDRLRVLQKKEKEVFELEDKPMIKIERAKQGNDQIIEVLRKNDADPVVTYYNSAIEVCEALIRFLNK